MNITPCIYGSVVPVLTLADLALPWLMPAHPDNKTSQPAGNESALAAKHVVTKSEDPATTPGGEELTIMEVLYLLTLLGVYLYGVWVPGAKL